MKERRNDVAGSVLWATFLLAASLWCGAALLEYLWFNTDSRSFPAVLAAQGDPHELVLRMLFTIAVVMAGLTISRTLSRLALSEQAACESSENLRTTLNSIGDAVITTDVESVISGMNPVAEELTGWTFKEAKGKRLADVFTIVDAQTREPAADPVQKVLGSGTTVGLANDTLLLARDGVERQIADSGAPILDKDGVVTGVALVFREVTEEHRMQQALREQERFLQNIFDSIQDGLSVLDRDLNVVRANAWMQKMYAHEAPLEGTKCYAVYQQRDSACPWCPTVKAMETGETQSAEVPFPNAQEVRGWIDVSAFPLKDERGEVTGVIEHVKDITDRKRVEEVLRESEALLSRSQAIGHIGSWEFDVVANRLTWSDEVYRMFGLRPQEFGVTYEAFFDAVHPDDRAAVDAAYTESLREGRDGYEIEHRVVRRDTRDIRVVHEKCEHVKDASDQIVRSIGIVQDITERKRAEEERRRLTAILETTSDLVSISTPEGQLVYLNREGRRMLGWGANEDLSNKVIADAHPDWALRVVNDTGIPAAIQQGAWRGETALLTPDGREIPVSQVIMSHRSADGSLDYLSTIMRDMSERKRAEEALLNAKLLSEDYINSLPGLFYVFDEQRFVRWNNAWEDITGYSAKELGKMYGTDFFDGETRRLIEEKMGEVFRDGAAEAEAELVTKDGRRLPYFFTGLRREIKGKPHIVGLGVDIAERKRAEEQLRRGEELLEEMGSMARIGGWEHDLITGDARWTRGTYEIVEIEPGAPIPGPKEHLDYYLPEDRAALEKAYQRAVKTGEPFDLELRCHTAKGRLIWARAIGRPVTERDKCVKMKGTFQDITDRKRAEEALRLTQFAVEHATDAAFWAGSDAKFQYVNQSACRLLGYTRDELLRMTVHDVNPDFPAEAWLEHWDELKRRGSMVIESVNQTKDGRIIPVEISINLVVFEGREYDLAFTRDITERKRAEEEREKLEAQLRQSQKLEAVGQLAGGVAHDFNNILTAILGNVELSMDSVRSELGADHGVVHSMEQIEKAAQRASALTRQLLAFSRRDVVQPRALSMNSILADLDKMLRWLITENIALDTITDPGLKSVWADAGRVEQVIVNLVVNAVQAMPDGGRLTLETQNVVLDEDYARSHAETQPGPYVLLAVIDTGCGMDAATRERIFEPFFTTKSMDRGTGLGLATVHGIVKQSGGHIFVYSEPGHGSTFKVYLPAIEAAPAEQTPTARPDAAPRGDETVLLCEDDRPVCELIAEALRTAGYTVVTAGTGQEGLAAAEAHASSIDLLITDVIMPDMNGRALSERLVAVRPDLPTLFISGYTSNVIAHHGVLDEGVEFLEKPFTRQSLLTKVRTVLDQMRTRT